MARREEVVVAPGVRIPAGEIRVRAERPRGPGGQNVNKATGAAVLRFDVAGSPCLPEHARRLALRRLAPRLTRRGELVLRCDEHRTWERNRAAVIRRFRDLLAAAVRPPRRRVPTTPPPGADARRLAAKRLRGQRKALRRPPEGEE